MTLKDIAIRTVETAAPDASVERLARVMADAGVGSVVVTDENRVVGVVTDRDVALTVASGDDPTRVTAADVMAAEPLTLPSNAGIAELTEAMADGGVRRIPVVDDGGVIVGIVTLDDVVRLLSAELANLATVIDAESPR
jgi:CBS domain-containing protein